MVRVLIDGVLQLDVQLSADEQQKDDELYAPFEQKANKKLTGMYRVMYGLPENAKIDATTCDWVIHLL